MTRKMPRITHMVGASALALTLAAPLALAKADTSQAAFARGAAA